jgi:2OG-Fe(II) oxygenase superfamily
MIQATSTGLIVDREEICELRSQFQANHCVLLRGLLAPQLLELIFAKLEGVKWNEFHHGEFAFERVAEPGAAFALLHFVANSPRFLAVIHEITGCGPFSWFGGRIYRMEVGHYNLWHGDTLHNRLLAMSINLSKRAYRGGLFQIREMGAQQPLAEIANTGPGDALFFRISSNLQHRVTKVVGTEPKTAFAGWFDASATLRSRLESAA